MQVVTGTVIGGKVLLEGVSLPDGTVVTILAMDSEATVRLPPALQADLEEALDEADREEGISGDNLLDKLRKYGRSWRLSYASSQGLSGKLTPPLLGGAKTALQSQVPFVPT